MKSRQNTSSTVVTRAPWNHSSNPDRTKVVVKTNKEAETYGVSIKRKARHARSSTKEKKEEIMMEAKDIVDKAYAAVEIIRLASEEDETEDVSESSALDLILLENKLPTADDTTTPLIEPLKTRMSAALKETTALREKQVKLEAEYSNQEHKLATVAEMERDLSEKLTRLGLERQQRKLVLSQFQAKISRQIHYLQEMSSDLGRRGEIIDQSFDDYERALTQESVEKIEAMLT